MSRDHHSAATERLDAARNVRDAAVDDMTSANGSVREFHAAVQLKAAANEVEAREAWLAWSVAADE